MTFQQLLYVSEVAQVGSINKAAQALYVSQSTVSNSIKDLEDELKLQIFQRSNTGIQLTAEGKEFLNYARSLLDQKNHVETIFKKSDIQYYTRLSVASQHLAFPICALIELMKSLEDQSYVIAMKELMVDELLDEVCTGKSDVGVVFASGVMQHYMDNLLSNKGLEFYEICRLQPHICVRADHPLAKLDKVCKKDLEPFPYLAIHQDYTTPFDHTEEVRLFSKHKPCRTIYVTDRASIYDVILNTDAYQFSSGMRTPRERTLTRAIPICEELEKMRFGWIKLKRKSLSNEAQHFIDNLSRLALQWAAEANSGGK